MEWARIDATYMDRGTTDDLVVDIAEEIAAREGVEPTDLPPLARTVDPEALCALVASQSAESITVEFTYQGYHVTVTGGGGVEVRDVTSTLR